MQRPNPVKLDSHVPPTSFNPGTARRRYLLLIQVPNLKHARLALGKTKRRNSTSLADLLSLYVRPGLPSAPVQEVHSFVFTGRELQPPSPLSRRPNKFLYLHLRGDLQVLLATPATPQRSLHIGKRAQGMHLFRKIRIYDIVVAVTTCPL